MAGQLPQYKNHPQCFRQRCIYYNPCMTVRDCLQEAVTSIAVLDAEVLLAFVLETDRVGLIRDQHTLVQGEQYAQYTKLVRTRASGQPVAYLTGQKAFYGLDLAVNDATLIPRPDTEVLVDAVLQELQRRQAARQKQPLLLDIGTGSGAIPIAVLQTRQTRQQQLPRTVATDVSRGALRIARKNAQAYRLPITFLQGSLLTPVKELFTRPYNTYIIITANLPYLTPAQMQEPSIQAEPRTALVSGNDGLDHYRDLFVQLADVLQQSTASMSCYVECDPTQVAAVQGLVSATGLQQQTVFADLAGHERVVKACTAY